MMHYDKSYEYTMEEVKMYTRVPLGDIIRISKGELILGLAEKIFDLDLDERRLHTIPIGGSKSRPRRERRVHGDMVNLSSGIENQQLFCSK